MVVSTVSNAGVWKEIAINGDKSDWDGVPAVFVDTEGDMPEGYGDLLSIKMANDDTHVYILKEYSTILDSNLYWWLYFDTDLMGNDCDMGFAPIDVEFILSKANNRDGLTSGNFESCGGDGFFTHDGAYAHSDYFEEISIPIEILRELTPNMTSFNFWLAPDNEEDEFGHYSLALVEPSLTISPPSGDFISTQSFDLALIVENSDATVNEIQAYLNGVDVSGTLSSCNILGALVGGQTLRCGGLSGDFLGTGVHQLTVTLNLSDGTSVTDYATWTVKQNTE